jgi:uncharacterized protein YaiL (DUF2058 family)
MSLEQAYSLRQQDERRQAQQARARQQAEDRRRRLINQGIRDIVRPHRQNDEGADMARNFLYRGRIRKIYVTPDQHRALGDGSLGIVYLSGTYHLLAREHLETVRKLSAEHVVDLDADEAHDDGEHPVPDDLDW